MDACKITPSQGIAQATKTNMAELRYLLSNTITERTIRLHLHYQTEGQHLINSLLFSKTIQTLKFRITKFNLYFILRCETEHFITDLWAASALFTKFICAILRSTRPAHKNSRNKIILDYWTSTRIITELVFSVLSYIFRRATTEEVLGIQNPA